MKNGINELELMGNLGEAPQLKTIEDPNGGQPRMLATFSIATNEPRKQADGSYTTETTWHDVEVWGNQAQSCAQYLQKGSPVIVKARLGYGKWTLNTINDQGQSEQKNVKVPKIYANRVLFLPNPNGQNGQNGQPQQYQQQGQPQQQYQQQGQPQQQYQQNPQMNQQNVNQGVASYQNGNQPQPQGQPAPAFSNQQEELPF